MYVLLLSLAVVCASAIAEPIFNFDLNNASQYFEEFIVKYNKTYTGIEKETHFVVFKYNLEKVNRLNNEAGEVIYGITQFTDLTVEEFLRSRTGYRPSKNRDSTRRYILGDHCELMGDNDIADEDVPEFFDWRDKNVVTPVKNQLLCASCWAFATASFLESQYAIKYNKQIHVSEQQIIDCSPIDDGCCGGVPQRALAAIKDFGGLMLNSDYVTPYIQDKHICKKDESKSIVKVKNCLQYILTSQEKVKRLLYKTGPLIIAIKSEGLQHILHDSRIVTDKQCSVGQIDHVVLLVGYGKENDMPYWIVKNSWGTDIEEQGYFRMERSNNLQGACGMLTDIIVTGTIE